VAMTGPGPTPLRPHLMKKLLSSNKLIELSKNLGVKLTAQQFMLPAQGEEDLQEVHAGDSGAVRVGSPILDERNFIRPGHAD
ncbi:MAG: hypothetical protein ACKODU_03530, partial [Limnohabitans sp.]